MSTVLGKKNWIIKPKYYSCLPISVLEEIAYQRDFCTLCESVIDLGHIFRSIGLVHIGCARPKGIINEIKQEARIVYEYIKEKHPHMITEEIYSPIDEEDEDNRGLPSSDVKTLDVETLQRLGWGDPVGFIEGLQTAITIGMEKIQETEINKEEETPEGEEEEHPELAGMAETEEETEITANKEQMYTRLQRMLPAINTYLTTNNRDFTPPINRMVSTISDNILKVMMGYRVIPQAKTEKAATRKDISTTGAWVPAGRWADRFLRRDKDAEWSNGRLTIDGIVRRMDPTDEKQVPVLQSIANHIKTKVSEWASAAEQATHLETPTTQEIATYVADIKNALKKHNLTGLVAIYVDRAQQDVIEKRETLNNAKQTGSGIENAQKALTLSLEKLKKAEAQDLEALSPTDTLQIAASKVPPPGLQQPVYNIIEGDLQDETKKHLATMFARNALDSIKELYFRVEPEERARIMESGEYDEEDAEWTVKIIKEQAMDELLYRRDQGLSVSDEEIDEQTTERLIAYEIKFQKKPKIVYAPPSSDEEVESKLPENLRPWVSKVRRDILGIQPMNTQEKESLYENYNAIKNRIYFADFKAAKPKIIAACTQFRTEVEEGGKLAEKHTPISVEEFQWVNNDEQLATIKGLYYGEPLDLAVVRRNDIKISRTSSGDEAENEASFLLNLYGNRLTDEVKQRIYNSLFSRPISVEFPPGSGEITKIGFDPESVRNIQETYSDQEGNVIPFRKYIVKYTDLDGQEREREVFTGPSRNGNKTAEENAMNYARAKFGDIDNRLEVDAMETEETIDPIALLLKVVVKKSGGKSPFIPKRGVGGRKIWNTPGDYLWGIYLSDENGKIDFEAPIGLKRAEDGSIENDDTAPEKLFAFQTLRDAELALSLFGAQLGYRPRTRNPQDPSQTMEVSHGREQVEYETRSGRKLVISNYENPRSLRTLDRITDIMQSSDVVNPNDYKQKLDPSDPFSARAFSDDDSYQRWLDQKLQGTGWTVEQIFDTIGGLVDAAADRIYYKFQLYKKQQELDDVREEARKLVFKALENDKRRNTWFDPQSDRYYTDLDNDPQDPTKPDKDQLRDIVMRSVKLTPEEALEVAETAEFHPQQNVWVYQKGNGKPSYFKGEGENQKPSLDEITRVIRASLRGTAPEDEKYVTDQAKKVYDGLEFIEGSLYWTDDILENGRPTWWKDVTPMEVAKKLVSNKNFTTKKVEEKVNELREGPEGRRMERSNPGFVRYVLFTINKELSNRFMAGPSRRITAHPAGGTWDVLIVSAPVQAYVMWIYTFLNPQDGKLYSHDGIRLKETGKIPDKDIPKTVEDVLNGKHFTEGFGPIRVAGRGGKPYVIRNDYERSEGRSSSQEFRDKIRQVNKTIRQVLNGYADKVKDEEGRSQTLNSAKNVALLDLSSDWNMKRYLNKFVFVRPIPLSTTLSLDQEIQGAGDKREQLIDTQKSLSVPTPDTIAQIHDTVDMIMKIPSLTDRERNLLMLKFGLHDDQAKVGFFRDLLGTKKVFKYEWHDPVTGFKMPANKNLWRDPETGMSFEASPTFDPDDEYFRELIRPDFDELVEHARNIKERFDTEQITDPKIMKNALRGVQDDQGVRKFTDTEVDTMLKMIGSLRKGDDPMKLFDEIIDRLESVQPREPDPKNPNDPILIKLTDDVRRELLRRKASNSWQDKESNFAISLPEGMDPQQNPEDVRRLVHQNLMASLDTDLELYATRQKVAAIKRQSAKTGEAIDPQQISNAIMMFAGEITGRLAKVDTEEYKANIASQAQEIAKRLKLREVSTTPEKRKVGPAIDTERIKKVNGTISTIRTKLRNAEPGPEEAKLTRDLADQEKLLEQLKNSRNFYDSKTGKYYSSSDIADIQLDISKDVRYVKYYSKKYGVTFPDKDDERAILLSLKNSKKQIKALSEMSDEDLVAIANELSNANIGPLADDLEVKFQAHRVGDENINTYDNEEDFLLALRDEAGYISKNLTSAHFAADSGGRISENTAVSLIDRLKEPNQEMVDSTISRILDAGPDETMLTALKSLMVGGGKWKNTSFDKIWDLYQKETDPNVKKVLQRYVGPAKYHPEKGEEGEEEEVITPSPAPPHGYYGIEARPGAKVTIPTGKSASREQELKRQEKLRQLGLKPGPSGDFEEI